MLQNKKTIALAMTGASGVQYGIRLLEILLKQGHRVYFMLSKPAQVVIGMDTDLKLPSRPKEIQRFFESRFDIEPGQLFVFDRDEWTAPIASGTGAADSMVICPCTSGTMGCIAAGISNNLIHRAADVLSLIHI